MVRKVVLFLFGLLPALFLSYHAAAMIVIVTNSLFAGDYVISPLVLAVTFACLYGTYSLGMAIFAEDRSLDFIGLSIGTLAILAMIASPLVQLMLESLGLYECKFNSGLDCYSGTTFFAFYALIPLPVFAILTLQAWIQRKARAHQDPPA